MPATGVGRSACRLNGRRCLLGLNEVVGPAGPGRAGALQQFEHAALVVAGPNQPGEQVTGHQAHRAGAHHLPTQRSQGSQGSEGAAHGSERSEVSKNLFKTLSGSRLVIDVS